MLSGPASPPLRPSWSSPPRLPSPPQLPSLPCPVIEIPMRDGSSIFKARDPQIRMHLHIGKDFGRISDETKPVKSKERFLGPAPGTGDIFLTPEIHALLDRITQNTKK